MGPGDHVGVGVGDRLGRVAGLGLDQDRVGEEGRAGGRLGELLRELAVGEVQGALAHEPGGGGVPEGGRAAVAERDLVAVGQAEELAEPARTRPTRSRTGAWRCEVPISVGALGEPASASGRTFEGPQPKRPSAGFSSAGICGGGQTVIGRRQVIDIGCPAMSDDDASATAQGRRLRRREPLRLGEGYGFRKIRKGLGVTAFGVNAIVIPPSYETGRHLHEEQEELYFLPQRPDRDRLRRRHRARARARRLRLGRRPDRAQGPQPQRLRGRRLRRRRRQGRLRRPRRRCPGEVSRFGDNAPPAPSRRRGRLRRDRLRSRSAARRHRARGSPHRRPRLRPRWRGPDRPKRSELRRVAAAMHRCAATRSTLRYPEGRCPPPSA